MSNKSATNILDIIADYKHLANPLYTLGHEPDKDKAPGGSWALSKDDKWNMGLWNAVGVASWLLPTSALAAYFANKWWERKMRNAVKKAGVSRISTIRPTLTPDNDLKNIENIISDPAEEVRAVNKILKSASGEDEENRRPKDMGARVGDFLSDTTAATVPILAVPLTMWAAKTAVDKIYEKRMAARLREERIAIRNHQNLLDHEVLKLQGLIKGASKEDSISQEEAREYLEDRKRESDGKTGLLTRALSVPILTALLGTSAIAVLASKYLNKNDNSRGLLKYVKEKSLGHNVMQTTPELGLEQFGVPVDQIVSRPGDKKQPGYELVDTVDAVAIPIQATETPQEDVKLVEELEELKPQNTEEKKKEDALF